MMAYGPSWPSRSDLDLRYLCPLVEGEIEVKWTEEPISIRPRHSPLFSHGELAS